jgi:methionyl-tRNA formyltransferase
MKIYNLVRAVTEPYPGAFAYLPDGQKLFIWWALPDKGGVSKSPEGELEFEKDGVFVRAMNGRLRLLDIEVGEKRMKAHKIREFFRKQEGGILK